MNVHYVEDKKDIQATNIKDSNDSPANTITDEDPKPRCQSKNSMGHSRTNTPLLNSQFQYIRKEEMLNCWSAGIYISTVKSGYLYILYVQFVLCYLRSI
jgi:hypothetical protein